VATDEPSLRGTLGRVDETTDVGPVGAEPGADGEGPRFPRFAASPDRDPGTTPRRRRSIRYRIDSTMGRGCYMPCPEGESQFWHPSPPRQA
jgi:hypothetical protein